MELRFYLLLLLAYLIGALSPSFLIGKFVHGLDLREHGSGNLGFTNAMRVLGKKAGIFVFIFDLLKGFLPVFCFPVLLSGQTTAAAGGILNVRLFLGLAAICGHCLPFYLNFRGGKGVLTSLGAFAAIHPLAMGIAFVCGVSLIFITGFVSVGSLSGALIFAISATALNYNQKVLLFICIAWLTAAFVFYMHRSNIRRLLNGTEPRYYDKPNPGMEAQPVDQSHT